MVKRGRRGGGGGAEEGQRVEVSSVFVIDQGAMSLNGAKAIRSQSFPAIM